MPRISDIHSIMVPAENADLYDLVYSEILGGTTGCIMNVNGVTVNVGSASNIALWVRTISGGTGCYLLGEKPYEESNKSFVSYWSTYNTSSGSSGANQIKLPLTSTGIYSFIVDWGDGSSNKITSWNQTETTHTYTSPDTYKVTITGILTGWVFNNTGDRLKLLTIEKWGPMKFINNSGIFYGCTNLTLSTVKGVPDLSSLNSLTYFFFGCSGLTSVNGINEWNLNTITSLNRMFEGATNFNSNVGNWDVSNVTDFQNVFNNCYMFNNGGSPSINNWDTSNGTTMSYIFGGTVSTKTGVFNQPIGNWNTSKVTNMTRMLFNQITFNQDISTKTVIVNGITYTAWDTLNVTTMNTMLATLSSNDGVFNQPIGNWNISKVTNMFRLFYNQRLFSQDILTKVVTVNGVTYTAWDTLNVTTMNSMFLMRQYNVDGGTPLINNWNISKVTDIYAMFGFSYINDDISTKVVTVGGITYNAWDTLNVINMNFTFLGAKNTSSIGNWNTSKVTTMSNMFYLSDFNYDISTKAVTVNGITYTAWDTLNVTNMSLMFAIIPSVNNLSIGNWNTSKVTDMSAMFAISNFNEDIGTKVVTVNGVTYTAWDTLNVTTMNTMFLENTMFNNGGSPSINNWNTSKVTTTAGMFFQSGFNQDIGTKVVTVNSITYTAWDTLNVTSMDGMFYENIVFNNDGSPSINNWNTSKVTNINKTFFGAIAFNQPLDNWNVSLVTQATTITFMENKTYNDYSTQNYDNLLIGWASRPVKPNLTISFGTIRRTSASANAITILTSSPNFWTIIDGGI